MFEDLGKKGCSLYMIRKSFAMSPFWLGYTMLKSKLGAVTVTGWPSFLTLLRVCLFLSIFTCPFSSHTPSLGYKLGKSAEAPQSRVAGLEFLILQLQPPECWD